MKINGISSYYSKPQLQKTKLVHSTVIPELSVSKNISFGGAKAGIGSAVGMGLGVLAGIGLTVVTGGLGAVLFPALGAGAGAIGGAEVGSKMEKDYDPEEPNLPDDIDPHYRDV